MNDMLIRTVIKRKQLYLNQDDVEKFILKAAAFGKTDREVGILHELAEKLGRMG